jgi:hypothetical protein
LTQRALRCGASKTGGISPWLHAASARRQRGAKEQPDGRRSSRGGAPGIASSLVPPPSPAATPHWRRGRRPQPRCGSLPQRRAARRSAAQRGLDKRRGMGEGSISGVPLGQRPREGRFWTEGEGCQTGLQRLRGVRHPSATRTSPTRPGAMSWAESTQANCSWRQRAGAMGGGMEARLR